MSFLKQSFISFANQNYMQHSNFKNFVKINGPSKDIFITVAPPSVWGSAAVVTVQYRQQTGSKKSLTNLHRQGDSPLS